MGCLLVLWGLAVYVVTGIYSFQMLGVDNFWLALVWLVVWHVAASIVGLAGFVILMLVDEKFG